MKLSDALRRRDDGDPLDERVAAELEALDSALRGEPVGPEMSSLATLATDLRAEREEIGQDFSASLDAWAAAGFPRGQRPGASEPSAPTASAGLQRLRERIASTPPRRLFAPVLAGATAIVVVGVVISQSGNIAGNDDSSSTIVDQGVVTSSSQGDQFSSGDTPSSSGEKAANGPAPSPAGSIAGSGAGGGAAAEPEAARLAPDARAFSKGERDAGTAGALHYLKHQSSIGALKFQNAAVPRGQDLNQIHKHRKVERDAQLSLAADADQVPDVAAQATDVTERYHGHVLSSQVSGSSDSATATMELAIPSKNLDAAISDLSDLADVSSSSQASNDITKPFVSARDELSGLRAQRESLLTRLAAATTDQETADLKAKLASVNDQIANARASVQKLQSKASISHVSLRISSDDLVGGSSGDDNDWSFGDALHDAGHVLTVVAGIALISAAVLLPLAVLALLVALVLRSSRARSRERALDD